MNKEIQMAKEDEANVGSALADISKKVKTFEQKLGGIEIKSDEDMAAASDFMAAVKVKLTETEALRTAFVKPLNDQVKFINAKFKEQTDPLNSILSRVRRAIGDFISEKERKAKAEEARLQKIRDAADAKRRAQNKPTIAAPLAVQEVQTHIRTAKSAVSVSKVWKFEILDEALIPREYLVVDSSSIRVAMNKGVRNIPGVRFYQDNQVASR